ncbi:hypothetical protein [Streptosporangium canum]|uniref:hypothetical protein n=1 Tax=Streptosporangium canum TaxID=324952 RepID=UPI003787E21C
MTPRTTAAALVSATALVSLLGAAGPAQASTGQVVVFSTELMPLDIYDNPTGCR